MTQKQVVTINTLTPPLVVNGETAEYSLTTSTYIVDDISAAEVLLREVTDVLYSQTRRQINAEYTARKDSVIEERDTATARANAEVVEIDKVITATTGP